MSGAGVPCRRVKSCRVVWYCFIWVRGVVFEDLFSIVAWVFGFTIGPCSYFRIFGL